MPHGITETYVSEDSLERILDFTLLKERVEGFDPFKGINTIIIKIVAATRVRETTLHEGALNRANGINANWRKSSSCFQQPEGARTVGHYIRSESGSN